MSHNNTVYISLKCKGYGIWLHYPIIPLQLLFPPITIITFLTISSRLSNAVFLTFDVPPISYPFFSPHPILLNNGVSLIFSVRDTSYLHHNHSHYYLSLKQCRIPYIWFNPFPHQPPILLSSPHPPKQYHILYIRCTPNYPATPFIHYSLSLKQYQISCLPPPF